jgi:hypothetical protein
MILLFLILAATVFLRLPFVLEKGNDDCLGEWLIDRSSRGDHSVEFHDSVIPGFVPYPNLTYVLLSFFPKAWRIRLGIAQNILWDIVFITTVWFLTPHLLNELGVKIDGVLHGLVGFVLATSPFCMPPSERLQGIKSRSFGEAVVSLTLLNFYFINQSVDWVPFALFFLGGILAVSSSKMAHQAFLFIGVTYAVLSFQWMLLICYLVFYLTLFLLPGRPFRMLRLLVIGHIDYMRWFHVWVKTYKSWESINRFSDLRDGMSGLLRLKPHKFMDLVRSKNHYVMLIVLISPFFPPMMEEELYFSNNPFNNFCLKMIISGLFVFILTTLRPLLMFGNADRYIGFVYFFAVFALIGAMDHKNIHQSLLMLVIGNLVIIGFVYFIKNIKKFNHVMTPLKQTTALDELKKFFFDSYPGKLKIAVAPTKFTYVLSSYFKQDQYKYLYPYVSNGEKGMREMHVMMPDYSKPTEDREVLKQYTIDVIVVRTFEIKDYPLNKGNFDLVYENSEYQVYKV